MWCGWNSPYINHFIQPDTIVPDPFDPQALDRYAYAQNNPVRYNDPSGHMAWEGEGGGNRIRSTLWDSKRPCYCDRKAAEEAYFHFLDDPMHFIEQYVNPSLQGKEYADLDVFAMYSTLGTEGGMSSADQLIWNTVAEGFGVDTANSLYEAQFNNVQASWTGGPSTDAGSILAAATVRALTPKDLGIQGSVYVRGTLTIENGVATAQVDMLAGNIENPLTLMSNLAETAQAEGATVLRVNATVVNERLYNILTKRYGMVSIGGYDYIEIPLAGGKK